MGDLHGTVRLLLSKDSGTDHIRTQDIHGKTALHKSAIHRGPRIVKILIKADPSIDHILIKDRLDQNALDKANAYRRPKTTELLGGSIVSTRTSS